MLSGIAAIAGVIVVAIGALRALDVYKMQKQEDRRIEAAERVLTAAYDLQSGLRNVRHPMHLQAELARAKADAEEAIPHFEELPEAQRSRLQTAQVVFNRLKGRTDVWDKARSCLAIAKALFGNDVEARLTSLLKSINLVRAAANTYSHGDGGDELQEQARAIIWADPNDVAGENNETTRLIHEDIVALETMLLGVLRAGHASKAKA